MSETKDKSTHKKVSGIFWRLDVEEVQFSVAVHIIDEKVQFLVKKMIKNTLFTQNRVINE